LSLLLVGGTGFLGSHVAARLAGRRDLVVLVRRASDTSVLPAGVSLRVGDLEADLPLDGVDTLVYCASMGFGHVPRLVRQLEASGVQRAVFVSTTAIFTRLPAASRAVRLEAEAAVQASRLQWTVLRPTMIYGTHRDRNISRLLGWLRRWPVVPVCGDGLWQPIYIEDLADALVAALGSARTVGRAYNLAGAAPALRLSELVLTAARALDRQVLLLRLPLRLAVVLARLTGVVKPEQVWRLAEDKAFDCSDAVRDFGFAPRSFDEGVRLEVRQLREQTRWLAPSVRSPRPSGPAPRG
jgi:nucleoside-diphosphate-sugar epimerase